MCRAVALTPRVDPGAFDDAQLFGLTERGLNRANRLAAATADFLYKQINRKLWLLIKNLIKDHAQHGVHALMKPDVFASVWITNENSLKHRRKCD